MNSVKEVVSFEKLYAQGRKVASEPARMVRGVAVLPLQREPIEEGRCCATAVRVSCVCRASYKCVTHGARCIGSHD